MHAELLARRAPRPAMFLKVEKDIVTELEELVADQNQQ